MTLLPADEYRKTRGIIRRGTRAAQPTASSVLVGTLYNVTDESKVERSNGVTWDSFASTGISPGTFTTGSVIFAGATGSLAQDNANFFWDDALNRLNVSVLSTPSIITASGALTIAPATGQSLNIITAGAGDFSVNGQLVLDTSVGFIGIGLATPLMKLHIEQSADTFNGGLGLERAGSSHSTWSFAHGSDDNLYFGWASSPGGSFSAKVIIGNTNGGRLGIGSTSAPSRALSVSANSSESEPQVFVTSQHATVTRIGVDHAINCGFDFYILATAKWAAACYRPSGVGNYDFTFYNRQLSLDAIFIEGDLNNVGIGHAAPTARLHVAAGTTAANTAPFKFTSGSLLTTAEAGAVEFLTDAFYGTISTGAARKTFAFLESPIFTTPNIGAANGASLSLSNTVNLISTGAAKTAGTATFVAGTVTINTTAATATAIIVVQRKTSGGTPGTREDITKVAGTSFTVTSDIVADTSTFDWYIVETH